MYENTADFDLVTNVFCGASASRWTYYRVRPSESTSSSSSSESSTSITTARSASTDPTDTADIDPATSTSDPTPVPEPSKGKSKAWIAGAVVGPIVGLALFGLLAWYVLSRRKTNTTPPLPAMQQQQHGAPAPNIGNPTQTLAPYYEAQKPNSLPIGVSSHHNWAALPPQPTQSSVFPHVQPPSPYGQQWQSMPVQGQQVYMELSPGQSPPPQNVQASYTGGEGTPRGLEHGERPFSAELDGGGTRA